MNELRQGTRVAIYARVSTDKQEREGSSLRAQVSDLERYAADNNLQVVATYSETFTGTSGTRPELERMLALARTGSIDSVLVAARDRFARDSRVGHNLLHELESLGVSIWSVNGSVERLTLQDDDAAFMTSIHLAVADRERRTVVGRLAAGRERARAEGKRFGRPPFGFTSRKGALIPIPAYETEVAERLRLAEVVEGLRHDGLTMKAIADDLADRTGDRWHAMKVSRLMKWSREVSALHATCI